MIVLRKFNPKSFVSMVSSLFSASVHKWRQSINRDAPKSIEKTRIPESYWVGQELDWEASNVRVDLVCELPFWIMVPNCVLDIEVRGCKFHVAIRDDFLEKYIQAVGDSKTTCIYIGPPNPPTYQLDAIKRAIELTTRS